MFHLVRLIEDHEVVAEQDAALHFLLQPRQQGEKERVVQHQHVGGKDAIARALKETDAMLLGEIGWVTAELGRTQPALGADLRPNFGVRFDVEIREAAVGGGLRPFVNALQAPRSRRSKQVGGLLHRLCEAPGAEVIRPAL